MAKIPDPLAAERPSARAPGGIARLAVVAPEGPGRGLMAAGGDVQQAAEELYRHQKIEEDRVNTLRAEEAYNKQRERALELSIGEQEGFAHLKGAAAVTRPILPEWTKRFDDSAAQIASTLSNDTQKERFKQRVGVGRLQYQEEIYRHLAREGDTYAKEVFDGTMVTEQRNAVARWDSKNDIDSSLERIKNAVEERGDRYGWPADYRKAILLAETGKVHSAVIQQAIASGDYVYAQNWFNEHRADVDLATAKQLEVTVRDGTQKQISAAYNEQFLAQRESKEGLQGLEKRVVGDKVLDETRKNIIHGRILGRLDALEAREAREGAQRERAIGQAISEVNSNTLAGMPATFDQLSPVLEAAKGTPMEREAEQMVRLADATAKFSRLTPIQQAAQITETERAARADPTKFDRKVVDAWKQIHASQKEMLGKDPVTFAVRQGIAEPVALDLTTPQGMGDELTNRFSVARSMQSVYQAPLRPLTEPEQQLVSRLIDGAGYKERREYLGSLFQASRGDVQGFSAIMAQLAPDHPVAALAGEYQAKGRNRASDLMLQGEAILRPNKKADGKPDSGSLIPMPPEIDLRREFDHEVRDAYAGHPEERNITYQATRAIYAKLSSDAGDKDVKVPDLSRLRASIELATGGVEEYRGKRTVMPYGMGLGEFKDQVQRRTQDIEASGALSEGVTAKTLQQLPLEAAGDGRYVFRSGDSAIIGKNNEKIILDFNRSAAFRTSGEAPPEEKRRPSGRSTGR